MGLGLDISYLILGVLFSGIAIIGNTYKNGKFTTNGKIAILLLALTIFIGGVKEYTSRQEIYRDKMEKIELINKISYLEKTLVESKQKQQYLIYGNDKIINYLDASMFNDNASALNSYEIIDEITKINLKIDAYGYRNFNNSSQIIPKLKAPKIIAIK